ncbi:uncharacterized protein LOC121242452 [Juglans microcarpa x Juglans regia]|uniref:uncharacterized protein LOC121242452 n=1 Tax=Juglans microcarpa x Juglans regia TaxID=2249226 RepID=UPI001B7F1C80|nr:uncharacterized protein LOC121242452 [Juglans microcarpa x Juglans regia]
MDVWSQGPMVFQKSSNRGSNFKELFEYLQSSSNQISMEVFCVIARGIWLRRNKLVFDDLFSHPTSVANQAIKALEDFNSVQIIARTNGPRHQMDSHVWSHPPEGCIKINWDAALSSTNGRIGIGLVARDHEGFIIASKQQSTSGFMDPLLAEAQGGYQAARWARELGINSVILEGDSQQIVNGLNQQSKR